MPTFTPNQSIYRTVTLAAIDQINFGGAGAQFRIMNRGVTDLWFRVDGVNPAVNGDGSHLLQAGNEWIVSDPIGGLDCRVTGTLACSYGVELI